MHRSIKGISLSLTGKFNIAILRHWRDRCSIAPFRLLALTETKPRRRSTQKANASNRNRATDRMCKRDAYIFLDLSIEFFLENSAGALLRKARTTLLRHLLILAYSLVSRRRKG